MQMETQTSLRSDKHFCTQAETAALQDNAVIRVCLRQDSRRALNLLVSLTRSRFCYFSGQYSLGAACVLCLNPLWVHAFVIYIQFFKTLKVRLLFNFTGDFLCQRPLLHMLTCISSSKLQIIWESISSRQYRQSHQSHLYYFRFFVALSFGSFGWVVSAVVDSPSSPNSIGLCLKVPGQRATKCCPLLESRHLAMPWPHRIQQASRLHKVSSETLSWDRHVPLPNKPLMNANSQPRGARVGV